MESGAETESKWLLAQVCAAVNAGVGPVIILSAAFMMQWLASDAQVRQTEFVL